MSGKQGRSGGKRVGAGRPPKVRAPAADSPVFASAEDYLAAVVAGTEPADPARISAARGLISYQRAKQRAPVKGATPTQLDRRDAQDTEKERLDAWARTAEKVRARLARERANKPKAL